MEEPVTGSTELNFINKITVSFYWVVILSSLIMGAYILKVKKLVESICAKKKWAEKVRKCRF